MAYNNKYNYTIGTAAKKSEYFDDYPNDVKKIAKRIEKKQAARKVNQKVRKQTVFIIATLFAMFMIITYRYNVISQSNLTAQKLKIEAEKANSNLSALAIDAEQSINLSEVEAYAKQKLGMQKPDKNQVIYVDSSTNKNVVKASDTNVVSGIFENIKGYLNDK